MHVGLPESIVKLAKFQDGSKSPLKVVILQVFARVKPSTTTVGLGF